MQRFIGIAAASAVALFAYSASADEVTGEIQNIDLTAKTFEVEGAEGMVFTASPTNTVGVDLAELKEGEMVRVGYAPIADTTGGPIINAMTLEKAE